MKYKLIKTVVKSEWKSTCTACVFNIKDDSGIHCKRPRDITQDCFTHKGGTKLYHFVRTCELHNNIKVI